MYFHTLFVTLHTYFIVNLKKRMESVNNSTLEKKKRIEFIDLAKGFCIILVVLTHVNTHFHVKYPLQMELQVFRMPLYFFLSGLFFKKYENIFGFIKRKINKLLIPFLFFYFFGSFLIPNLLHLFGYDVRNASVLGLKSLYTFLIPSQRDFPNAPIWFLLCLFNVNIIFYSLYLICQKTKTYFVPSLIIGSLCIGCFGYSLGDNNIFLPLYLDTACTSLPFFCFGYIFRKHTTILIPNKHDKYLPIWILMCFIYICLFAIKVSYHYNKFEGSIFALYSCGLFGTLFIIFLSKIIKKLPLISYWGRYSIIILCTHNLVVQFLAIILRTLPFNKETMCILNLTITMFLYLLIIPFCIKYLPYVTAQKDVIKIKGQ